MWYVRREMINLVPSPARPSPARSDPARRALDEHRPPGRHEDVAPGQSNQTKCDFIGDRTLAPLISDFNCNYSTAAPSSGLCAVRWRDVTGRHAKRGRSLLGGIVCCSTKIESNRRRRNLFVDDIAHAQRETAGNEKNAVGTNIIIWTYSTTVISRLVFWHDSSQHVHFIIYRRLRKQHF